MKWVGYNFTLDSIGLESVNEVIEDVHLIRSDVVESDGRVRATVNACLYRVVSIIPVPEERRYYQSSRIIKP